jgi:hypothetical protein
VVRFPLGIMQAMRGIGVFAFTHFPVYSINHEIRTLKKRTEVYLDEIIAEILAEVS